MVDSDGRNRYPFDDNWLSDGYGDYVRHYLRSMAALPELAPPDEDHILSSSSVIKAVEYKRNITELVNQGFSYPDFKNIQLRYTAYDRNGTEKIRFVNKPSRVMVDKMHVSATDNLTINGYSRKPLKNGGVLTVNRINGNEVTIMD
jgi:hypothetical protein